MKLVGLLDSPYVRRTAISMMLLGLRFEHLPISVFRGFDRFREINPVVKAPTLVCDDGTVLMDSTLIIDYAETLARPRSLMPTTAAERQQALRVIGLALAACEKCVQLIYEHDLRPPERQHAPWTARVTGQLQAAFAALEVEIAARPPLQAASPTQAEVTAAVAWHFTQQMQPVLVPATAHPALAALSAAAEALPAFRAAPHGEGGCSWPD